MKDYCNILYLMWSQKKKLKNSFFSLLRDLLFLSNKYSVDLNCDGKFFLGLWWVENQVILLKFWNKTNNILNRITPWPTALLGLTKFISTRPIFRARNFTSAPNQACKNAVTQNQSAHPIKKQLKVLLFVL